MPITDNKEIYSSKFLKEDLPYEAPVTSGWGAYQFKSGEHPIIYCISTSVTSEDDRESISLTEEKGDTFTQGQLLDDNDNQVLSLILKFATSSSIPEQKRVSNRLLSLFHYAKEEDSASIGISIDSLRNFYNFFQLNTSLKCPLISLTPDKTIYASWRGENKRVFSVHFLSTKWDANFIILRPNDRHPNRQEQYHGSTTIDLLMKKAVQYEAWSWVIE